MFWKREAKAISTVTSIAELELDIGDEGENYHDNQGDGRSVAVLHLVEALSKMTG
jgi:hypothetical protein